MSNNHLPKNPTVSAKQVADYLQGHPDFFADKPSLLADMRLAHDSGGAVSLIERQIALLRERHVTMQQQMETLINNARNNDRLFEKTKRLVLDLLNAENWVDIANVLLHNFHSEFNIHHTSLLIYGEQPRTIANIARIVSLQDAQKHLPAFTNDHRTVCGRFSISEQQFIFNGRTASIHSMAVAPLIHYSPVGLLAVGHGDAEHFRSGTDTLFLSYIGDVLARLLPKKR